jgi:hypothetical protein
MKLDERVLSPSSAQHSKLALHENWGKTLRFENAQLDVRVEDHRLDLDIPYKDA